MTQSTILSPRPHLGTEPRAHESTAPGRSLSLSLLPSLLSSHPLLRFAFLSPPRVRPTETYSSWRTKQRPPPSPSEDRSTDYPFPRKPGASQSLAHHPAKGLRNLGKKVKMLKMKEMQEILVPTASPGPRSHSFRSNPKKTKKSASYWGLARGPRRAGAVRRNPSNRVRRALPSRQKPLLSFQHTDGDDDDSDNKSCLSSSYQTAILP